jgi:Fe2+ transport system protein B
LDRFFGWLGGYASGVSPDWLGSLLADGIIRDLGSVLIFVPPIFLLFIAIVVLEDCGYMARAALVMDRLTRKIGLHGRSFIPMILGFGCNIPGIMACRTIENPKDRLTTILINPFMSCGVRLPIFAPAGFGQWQAAVSLIFGFLAKEVVVGTMGTIFTAEEGILGSAIAAELGWTPLVAFAFMVFCLLYVPCVAAIGAIRGEINSWKWAGFAALYTTVVAWIVATLIFQIGRLFTG